MATLSNYLTDTSRLLRDTSMIYTTQAQLTDYVNSARRQVCKVTGCLRALIAGNAPFGTGATPGLMIPGGFTPGSADTTITTFQTINGVEKYHFGYANRWLHSQWQGFDSILDIIDVAVKWSTGARPTMDWIEWEELQALSRSYAVGVFTYPFLWSTQGDGANGQVFLFPVPGQALEMEWDCSCSPKPLYSDNDYEAIPEPFTGAVPYYAAFRAYLASQRFGSAALMMETFQDHLGLDRAASDRGKVQSYYR